MPTYDIKNPALGVDLTIESNRELGMQDFYDILKSRVTPQKMLQAYERGDKQLAMEALDHGFFETGVGFMDAIGPAAESMGRGLQKIAYQGSGEDAVRLLHDHYKTSNYGNPGKYGNKWNEPVTKAAKWFGGLIDSENFTKGDVDVTANLYGFGGGFNLAVPDMAKTRRKVEKHLPAALAYAGLPDDKDMRARVVQRALGVEASKEAATRGQAAVEALGGYNLIGAMGKQGIDIVAGDWTEEGLKTAELDYLVKKYQTIDAMERGAEIAAANGGAARTLARGFGLPVDAKLDEQTYEDVVSGAAEPDRDVAMVQSLAMSPDMYLTAGAAGLYNTLRTSVKRGAILGAGRELLDGDEVVLALRAAGASADDPALVAAIESSEAAAKKLDELTQKAQQAAAQAVPHLSPEGQAIVAKALEASPIKAPLLNRAAGQALEKAGVGVEYVGRLAEFLNRWPQEQLATFLIGNMGVSEKVATNTAKALTKGLVTASYAGGISGFDPEVTDVLVGILVANPYLVTRLGADAAIVGRQMKMPPSATSLYARIGALPEGDGSMMAVQVDREGGKVLSHAETTAQLRQLLAKDRKFEPTPVTRFAAQTLARTGIGPTLSRFASGAQTAAAASSIPAAFGYAIGGAEGAGAAVGASWPFIGFGMAAGTLARYASMADVHARVQGSIAYAKDMLPPAQKEVFNALKPEAQRAFAVSWEMYPDVEYKFRQGKGSSFYTTDGGNSRVVVYADDAPANQFRALLAHEVSHHIEHSGIGALVDKLLLGDLDLKQPGIFTKKINGSPVFRYAPGQENPVGYMYDDTFAALRENYLERVASAPDISPEHLRILESNPHIIAREIFAEQGAASILTPKSIRRANAGVAEKSFRSLARTLTGNPVVRKFAHRIGLPTERQSRKIPSMVFKDFKEIPAIQRMLEDYNEGVLGLSPSARKRKRILVDEDEVAQVIFDAKELLTEDTVSRLKSGGHLAMDENGNVRTDSTGRPIFLPVREVNANNRALSNDIIDILENSERQGIEFDDGHLTLEENASGKKTAVGRFLDDSVIDQLAKTNRYNPEQIQMLRKISRSLREQSGDVYDLFYYSALKWNRSGRKVYGQIRGGDRRSIPFGIKVTQDGNLVIETISLDAFDSNVSWLANHPTWGRKMEIAFGAATKNEAVRNLNEMLPRYLQNQIKGIKNGEEGSNVTPDQRDLINAAIGKVNKAHVAENPILEGMGQRKTDRQQSYRSRRLDRIGNALKTETGFPVDITRIGKNLNPVRQHLPADVYHGTPHTFEPERGAPLGRFRNSQIGTGEGAAWFGVGHYFASKKEIADHHYREGLSKKEIKDLKLGDLEIFKDGKLQDEIFRNQYRLKRVLENRFKGREAELKDGGRPILEDIKKHLDPNFDPYGSEVISYVADLLGHLKNLKRYELLDLIVYDDFFKGGRLRDLYNDHRYDLGKGPRGKIIYDPWGIQRDLVGDLAEQMLSNLRAETQYKQGSLYKAKLAPAEFEYLYWDLPLSEHPKWAKRKLKAVLEGLGSEIYKRPDDYTGEDIYKDLFTRERVAGQLSGERRKPATPGYVEKGEAGAIASAFLKKAGIPGIKYLDGESRRQGPHESAGYNYVIFDEADIAITDKLYMPASDENAFPFGFSIDGQRRRARSAPEPPPAVPKKVKPFGGKPADPRREWEEEQFKSKSFQNWFTAKGRKPELATQTEDGWMPVILYHGRGSRSRPGPEGLQNTRSDRVYLDRDYNFAAEYADRGGPISLVSRAQNLFDYTNPKHRKKIEDYIESELNPEEYPYGIYLDPTLSYKAHQPHVKILKELGFDGHYETPYRGHTRRDDPMPPEKYAEKLKSDRKFFERETSVVIYDVSDLKLAQDQHGSKIRGDFSEGTLFMPAKSKGHDKSVALRTNKELIEQIDAEAKALGLSRNDYLNALLAKRKVVDNERVEDDITLPETRRVEPQGESGESFPFGGPELFMPTDGPMMAKAGEVINLPQASLKFFMPAGPKVNLADYADRKVFALTTDRLGIGQMFTGPKGKKKEVEVEAQGGRGFTQIFNGGGWAFSTKDAADRFITRVKQVADQDDSALVGLTVLADVNHLKSQYGQLAYANALRAAIDSGVITEGKANRHIRSIMKRILESNSAKSPKGESRKTLQSIKNFADYEKAVKSKKMNFALADWFYGKAKQKTLPISGEEAKSLGLDLESIARDLADPELADLEGFGQVVGLLEVFKDQTPVKSDFHYSYPWVVEGKRIGFLKEFMDVGKLSSTPAIRDKRGKVSAQPLQTVMPKFDRLPERFSK